MITHSDAIVLKRFPYSETSTIARCFVRCGWDGTRESERSIKEETKATIRVIPFDENPQKLKCIYSGKPARHEVLFAKAY